MNNDCRNIFEAYVNHAKMLQEAPPAYAMGDLDIPETGLKAAPGKGYALGKAAIKTGKSMKQIADDLVKKIQTQLFKPEEHDVDGVHYNLFYPGNEMKLRNDLQALVQKELGVGKTEAGYTARVVRNLLNIVVKDEATGGIAARPEKVKAAVATATAKPVRTETVFEIDKSVKIADKAIRTIILNLPDEDIAEKEMMSVLKNAISEYNDRPGIQPLKIRSFDLFDKLKEAGVIKEKQVEKQAAEGEGTGEVETIEDFPEGDEVTAAARQEFGLKELPGDRNYGDFS